MWRNTALCFSVLLALTNIIQIKTDNNTNTDEAVNNPAEISFKVPKLIYNTAQIDVEKITSKEINVVTNDTLEAESDSNSNASGDRSEDSNGSNGDKSVIVRSSESADGNDSGSSDTASDEDIQTAYGPVRGVPWRGLGNIISYIDIPYGAFKRFEPPKEPEPWQNVHHVTEHMKICPQIHNDTYVGDIDCLTISVFAPLNVKNASVLFHIYDSNFISGSANPAIYGPDHLVSKGVILVLPNYRLGPLGFLCSQNETAPGNAALKDLTLALNWTKENIEAFGGNPYNIVVSGDGSSGALVGYLSLSLISRNFFSKAITDSGSVLSHWAIDRAADITMTNFTESINKHGSLEEVNIETLMTVAKNVLFKPCIEKNSEPFITETPWKMMSEKEINITFMIGTASHAGMHETLLQTVESVSELNDDVNLLLPNDLNFKSSDQKKLAAEKVKIQYFSESNIVLDNFRNLSLYFTDVSYLGPVLRTARRLVESGANVFLYEFSFDGGSNKGVVLQGKSVEGAVIGDINRYIFSQVGNILAEESEEKHLSDLMIELWVSFIDNGKPAANALEWIEFKKEEQQSEEAWLSIGSKIEMKKGLHEDRMKLWTEIYDDYFVDRNLAVNLKPLVSTGLLLPLILWLNY